MSFIYYFHTQHLFTMNREDNEWVFVKEFQECVFNLNIQPFGFHFTAAKLNFFICLQSRQFVNGKLIAFTFAWIIYSSHHSNINKKRKHSWRNIFCEHLSYSNCNEYTCTHAHTHTNETEKRNFLFHSLPILAMLISCFRREFFFYRKKLSRFSQIQGTSSSFASHKHSKFQEFSFKVLVNE